MVKLYKPYLVKINKKSRYHKICPHAVIIVSKFLFLSETVRDVVDLKLSMKYMAPTNILGSINISPITILSFVFSDTPCTAALHLGTTSTKLSWNLDLKFLTHPLSEFGKWHATVWDSWTPTNLYSGTPPPYLVLLKSSRPLGERSPETAKLLFSDRKGCFEKPSLDKKPSVISLPKLQVQKLVYNELLNSVFQFESHQHTYSDLPDAATLSVYEHPKTHDTDKYFVSDRFHNAQVSFPFLKAFLLKFFPF